MPWCAVKGSFYIAYGIKDAHPAGGGPNPLDGFNLTGSTGAGRGLVVVFDIEDGEIDRADDPNTDYNGSLVGSKVAIVGDLPTSGTKTITVSIPDTDTTRQDALNALFGNGVSKATPAILGLFEAIQSLGKTASPPDNSAISVSSVSGGKKVVISGRGSGFVF